MTNGNQVTQGAPPGATAGAAAWGVMPVEARNVKIDSGALAGGIQGSFGVLSYKGKSWAVRYHGQTHPIWQYDNYGRPVGTVPALEVVILNVSPTLAKTYYEGSYVEGSTEAPDCWSPNAITPDPSSPKLQAMSCQTCPQNRFGSKITQEGRQSKACQDHKRIAIVPSGDMKNERYGGPMLMRVPPASLTGLLDYADRLSSSGWEWYALVTQISFDPQKAYPHILFHEVRPLSPQENAYVRNLQDDPRVGRIINEGVEFDPLTPEQIAERGLAKPHAATTVSPPAQPTPPSAAPPPTPQGQGLAQPASQPAPVHTPSAGWGAPTPEQPAQTAPPPAQWGGPPPNETAPAAPPTTPAPPPAQALQTGPPGMDPTHQYEQFLKWQQSQSQPPQQAATPAKAPRKPRAPRSQPVSPGPGTAPPTPVQGQASPSDVQPLPPTNVVPLPPPAAPQGAWGGPPAPQTNGTGQPAAASDPAMQQFDDRLSKLL